MHSNDQSQDQRHEALLSLYERTWEEIVRLREFEWKIAVTFVTLSGGFIALICSDGFKPLLTTALRWWLTAVQVFAMLFGVYCLIATHKFVSQQRNIRRSIEEVLGFYEKGVFTFTPVLPETWKGKPISFRFQAFDLLIPLTLTVLIVQALTIYLIWSVAASLPQPAKPAGRSTAIVSPPVALPLSQTNPALLTTTNMPPIAR